MAYTLEHREISQAYLATKLDSGEIRDTFIEDMESNTHRKFGILKTYLPPDIKPHDIVVDCGTSSGLLLDYLKAEFPDLVMFGLDLSLPALNLAVSRKRGGSFVAADIFKLPLASEKVKVFILSSIFHELFSYGGNGFSQEAVESVLQDMYRILSPGGRVIIKDPAKPNHPDEILFFKLKKTDGHNPENDDDILAIEPDKLSTFSKYLRFQLQFRPTTFYRDSISFVNDDGMFSAPAWYLSEFLRHRNLSDTTDHWNSEMREQYGVFTVDEMKDLFRILGYQCINVETSFNTDNHAVIKDDEVEMWTLSGDAVIQSERLPTGLVAVFEKPGKTGIL